MPIFVLGINHKTAPVEIREQLTFAPDNVPAALAGLHGLAGVDEAVIVSTCNRTELWWTASDENTAIVESWLGAYRDLDDDAIRACLYRHCGDAAVRHLFRVACGLDSMVLGEPQILGQLKQAYREAQAANTAGATISRAFQQAFSVAKQVRTDTGIGASPVSVAFAAVRLAHRIFAGFNNHTALLVGAGDTIELTARHLRAHGIGHLVIANRSAASAERLAAGFGATAASLDGLETLLVDADIVVCATASAVPVLMRAHVEAAARTRRHRPMFIVDLAVPRDVEPAIADLEDVFLYTVDDLRGVIEDGLQSRREAADEAEAIIEFAVTHFGGTMRVGDAVETIRALRDRAAGARDATTDEAMRMLARGDSPEEVMTWLAHALTNRLLHDPTVNLRDAGFRGDAEALRAARRLLGLSDEERSE